MIIRKADRNTESGRLPGKEVFDAMTRYNEQMVKAGVFLDGVGLKPSSHGARVTVQGGKQSVTDGPFTETKELIAGFTMIQAKSLAEAIEWVRRWPAEDGDVQLEIRPLYEPEDFAGLV